MENTEVPTRQLKLTLELDLSHAAVRDGLQIATALINVADEIAETFWGAPWIKEQQPITDDDGNVLGIWSIRR